MATLIPTTPIQGSPPEVIRLFNVMKRLPDEAIVCQRLPVLHGSGPDFCLIWHERLLFFAVSEATALDVQRNQQPDLFGEAAKAIGTEEESRLHDFLQTVADIANLPGAVLFPNVSEKQLKTVRLEETAIQWVGKEHLSPARFSEWLNGRLSQPLSPQQIDQIRQQFTPEVVVPSVFTVRQPTERHIEAKLDNYLLDYDQEHALKLDLNLTKAGHDTAKDYKLRLINGVAGSGKSLIVIYRAHMLRRLFPDKKILLLTHNRALIQDLRRRYARLSDGDKAVEMRTFMGWCYRHWPRSNQWRKLVRYRDRLDLVTQVWHEQLRDTAVSEQMLMDEIDWYKDRLLFSEADYLSADRSGRGFALTESMRQKMFAAMQGYHRGLQKRQLMDWGDVPRQLWRLWHEGEVALPHYDIILVDEAQFFAPLWFEIIKRILTPQTGHLFLVADASQGFLKRKQSWLSSGLEVRGRVHRLTKSYRTTREILDFATLLYRRRLPDDDDDIVVPDVANMPHGVLPVVLSLTSEQDEVTRVINEIRQLHQNGVPWRDILIIHASREETSHIITRLNRAFGANTAVDPGKDNPQNQIRVCSLNAATGLESPIVFLMGTHDLYEMEQSIRLSDEERAELVRDNTRKLYMAITRAGQRLVITYVGHLPEIFQID
ncbi:UvrD-helicase domain-containing protein [Candidatus Leptofilum sp.]|uniref:UvrD-helicase domain-containing protein n=1 Tax=Candidatus Leptofilum sp. TaxID=3241576 RepID=UPI003B5D02DE